ncbi:MAG: Ig-like domain-containing protein [Ignavibacteriales bacterium]|nr:Ig-like domain-containing protein [Ignavibacteriales bacterium]
MIIPPHKQLTQIWAAVFCAVAFLFISSCKESEGPAGSKGYDGKGYETLADLFTHPRVIYTYPSNNSRGPYDNYNLFQIRFNKIMDLTSLRKAITFPASDGMISPDTLNFSTVGGDIITFSAADSLGNPVVWKVGASYIIRIGTDASDIYNNHLMAPYSATFSPEPYFRVRTVTPKNMSINTSVTPKISVTFNSQIDSSIFSSIVITPPIALKWSLSSDFRIVASIAANIRLEADTQYNIIIHPSAHDKFGNYLATEFKSTFTTIPYRVSSTSIKNGTTDIPITLGQISFSLTAPIDTSSIKNGIIIEPPIKYYFWGTNGKSYKILFNQSEPFASSTKYTINLTSSIRSVSGKPLVPFTLEFTTAEPR